MERDCGNCRFWVQHKPGSDEGLCTRYPPVLNLILFQAMIELLVTSRGMCEADAKFEALACSNAFNQPSTACDMVCGEWRED